MKAIKKVGRPKKEERFVHKSFKLPVELSNALDAFSETVQENKSLIIRRALIEYIAKHHSDLDNIEAVFNLSERKKT